MKHNARLLRLTPADIAIGWRARVDLGEVDRLATLIASDGQTTPIGVRADPSGVGYELVYGVRRIKACEMLQTEVLAVEIEPEDEEHFVKLQISENLGRKDFDALELGEGMKHLKAIYEREHPETKHGATLKRGSRVAESDTRGGTARFTSHAAAMIGCGETKVKELIAVADLPESVKRDINKIRKSRERNVAVRGAVKKVRMAKKLASLDAVAEKKAQEREQLAEEGQEGRGNVGLHLGDNRKWLDQVRGHAPFVDMILTDPPFETNRKSLIAHLSRSSIKTDFGAWDKLDVGWVVEFAPLLKEGGQVLAFCPAEAIGDYKIACQAAGLTYRGRISWHKVNPGTMHRPGYLSSMEDVVWATKGDKFYFVPWENAGGRECHNFVEGPICQGNERLDHPTQKPEWLIKNLLERHSSAVHQVLDPFAGVGTTLACCKKRGQPCIGLEVSPEYTSQAVKRLGAL